MFSWELEGSMASLLGTGVTVDRLGRVRKLVLVVSFRHGRVDSESLGVAGVGFATDEGLAKKPRMLCCFPADAEPTIFFCLDGVLAGVFAATGVDLVDIVLQLKDDGEPEVRCYKRSNELEMGRMGINRGRCKIQCNMASVVGKTQGRWRRRGGLIKVPWPGTTRYQGYAVEDALRGPLLKRWQ